MKEKRTSVTLYLLILAITVLFTSMLVLCGMYLDLRLNGITSSLPGIPENDKWVFTNSSYSAYNSNDQLISPVFIGVKNEYSGMNAAAYDKDAREIIGKQVEPVIMSLFSGSAENVVFLSEDERLDFVKSTIDTDSYIYMGFYDELPNAAILPGLYGNGNYGYLDESFNVKYLFIMSDGSSSKGICFNDELDAWILHPSEEIEFDQKQFNAYNEVSGFAEFEFVSDTVPEPVFTESFSVKSTLIVPSFSFYGFNLGDSNTTELLKALDFNPNLVKTYTYSDNSVISFVGEDKELHVSLTEQKLYFSGYNHGIHLSEYLKYHPFADEYTFTDKLLCVKYLINSLDRILVGGDASPSIVSITDSDGETVFKLKYFQNGIAVSDDNYDMLVAVSGEYINRIEISAVFCDGGNLEIPVIPQRLALKLFDDYLNDESFAGFNAMFVNNPSSGTAEFVWTMRKDVE